MPTPKTPRLTGLKKVAGKPVDLLVHGQDLGDDAMLIVRLTEEGFELSDVVNMLSTSEMYLREDMVKRITGRSVRTVQRLMKEGKSIRLDSQQSVVAYQYALVLEMATRGVRGAVTGRDMDAKIHPYLNGYVPLELTHHPLGFQMVEQYLCQLLYGGYP